MIFMMAEERSKTLFTRGQKIYIKFLKMDSMSLFYEQRLIFSLLSWRGRLSFFFFVFISEALMLIDCGIHSYSFIVFSLASAISKNMGNYFILF